MSLTHAAWSESETDVVALYRICVHGRYGFTMIHVRWALPSE